MLPQLSIKVVTTQGSLQRATNCYLGKDYPRGQIVWRLYERFARDEFVGHASHNGLDGIPVGEAERFLLDLGVRSDPRLEQFRSGSDYFRFRESVIDRLDYPRQIRRGNVCNSSDDVRNICKEYEIEGLSVPDRWIQLLMEGDSIAVAAYLLSAGSRSLPRELDLEAKFQNRIGAEQKLWNDLSVTIPNVMLFLLRESAWVPATGGRRLRTSEIMLSSQGVRILRGIFYTSCYCP